VHAKWLEPAADEADARVERGADRGLDLAGRCEALEDIAPSVVENTTLARRIACANTGSANNGIPPRDLHDRAGKVVGGASGA
jgi:hypothetical protein